MKPNGGKAQTPKNISKKDENERRVHLFKNDFIVESSSGQSSQAIVFFGRDATLLIRVVLKQYIGTKKKSIMSEIKIFTLLENVRQEQTGSDLANVINQSSISLQGLPLMLGYKVSKHYSEIMMTHGGNCLEQWMVHIKQVEQRIDFAADMLRQILPALKILHGLNYSHGDLKPENVCARETKEGKLKFTLIDFGLC